MDIDNKLKQINSFLSRFKKVNFEAIKISFGYIILVGKLDDLNEEVIRITFNTMGFCSINMNFIYDGGVFISQLNEEEKYGEYGHLGWENNIKFKIPRKNEKDFLIMADSLAVDIDEKFLNV